jgi:hypothetical protein
VFSKLFISIFSLHDIEWQDKNGFGDAREAFLMLPRRKLAHLRVISRLAISVRIHPLEISMSLRREFGEQSSQFSESFLCEEVQISG